MTLSTSLWLMQLRALLTRRLVFENTRSDFTDVDGTDKSLLGSMRNLETLFILPPFQWAAIELTIHAHVCKRTIQRDFEAIALIQLNDFDKIATYKNFIFAINLWQILVNNTSK